MTPIDENELASVTVINDDGERTTLTDAFVVVADEPLNHPTLDLPQDFMLAIIRLAEEMGVSFAFPSQSIYVESAPGE